MKFRYLVCPIIYFKNLNFKSIPKLWSSEKWHLYVVHMAQMLRLESL